MSSYHLLDRIGSDGLAFGALHSEIALLAAGHRARFPGTVYHRPHVGEAILAVQSMLGMHD
jgi:hypothetical protein